MSIDASVNDHLELAELVMSIYVPHGVWEGGMISSPFHYSYLP
jgi:hypothetical protein